MAQPPSTHAAGFGQRSFRPAVVAPSFVLCACYQFYHSYPRHENWHCSGNPLLMSLCCCICRNEKAHQEGGAEQEPRKASGNSPHQQHCTQHRRRTVIQHVFSLEDFLWLQTILSHTGTAHICFYQYSYSLSVAFTTRTTRWCSALWAVFGFPMRFH